jgi:hypothetical protein
VQHDAVVRWGDVGPQVQHDAVVHRGNVVGVLPLEDGHVRRDGCGVDTALAHDHRGAACDDQYCRSALARLARRNMIAQRGGHVLDDRRSRHPHVDIYPMVHGAVTQVATARSGTVAAPCQGIGFRHAEGDPATGDSGVHPGGEETHLGRGGTKSLIWQLHAH